MIKRSELILGTGATAIALAGYLIDRAWGYDAFARSGSLIVAFGAALAGREIYLGERSIARNEARVEKMEATYLDAAGSGEAATPEAFSRLAKVLSEYRTNRLEQVGRMIYAEIAIVCFGTLIWGFGDLVV